VSQSPVSADDQPGDLSASSAPGATPESDMDGRPGKSDELTIPGQFNIRLRPFLSRRRKPQAPTQSQDDDGQ